MLILYCCSGPPPKPLVSHEMGNFGTFPDIPAAIEGMAPTNYRTESREAALVRFQVCI